MLNTLIHLLVPDAKIPPDTVQISVEPEGLSWGWAFFILICLVTVLALGYRKFAPAIPNWKRIVLIFLRGIFLALILLFLVHPVLHITVEEAVRRPLIVLLDTSQSMRLLDRRNRPEDLSRAALAKGVLSPSEGLRKLSASDGVDLAQFSRQQLLEFLAANTKLNLWPRLFEKTDLQFYGFGRNVTRLGEFSSTQGEKLPPEKITSFFHSLHYDNNLTALGDSLKEILNEQRGQSSAGILIITDGAHNTGSHPVEAAAMARQDDVPLFLYGVGVTNPPDIMVTGLNAPKIMNVKEKTVLTARIRTQGMQGKQATIQLRVGGRIVDQQPLEFRTDGEQEIAFNFTPDKPGEYSMEAAVPALPDEAVKDNNSAEAKVRVVDDKINILLIKQEPDWDFQYLLGMLQRDRRIKLKCILLKGDKELATMPDSPFLEKIPEAREELTVNDIIILSDTDPAKLGDARMQLLTEWVSKGGGGLVFIAGPEFCPNAYAGTPLEPLLPVEASSRVSKSYMEAVKLNLTLYGENSPLLSLSENAEENAALWKKFPGVSWTAWTGKARPGSQVLMTDPTPERVTRDGAMPVLVQQNYGLGTSLYIGFNETYRWRSQAGEKYYTRIWGQLIQALSSQRKQGTAALTQLRYDRTQYLVGDRIRVSGRIFKPGFEPLTDPEVPATMLVTSSGTPGSTPPQTLRTTLLAVPGRPGEYRCEIPAARAGSYEFSTLQEPDTKLKCEVSTPRVEQSDIAMNEKLLKDMAIASAGRFLREEDLDKLPGLVSEKSTGNAVFKKIPLIYSPLLFILALLAACLEWHWRRKLDLK